MRAIQPGDDEAAAPVRHRRQIAVVVVTLVVVTLALSFRADPEPPPLRTSSPVTTGQWRIAVSPDPLRLVEGEPYSSFDSGSERWLLLSATVENLTQKTLGGSEQVVMARLAGAARKPDRVWLRRDGSGYGELHPGLPEDVVYGWKLRASDRAPRQVQVMLMRQRYERRNPVFGWERWHVEGAAAEGTLPVRSAPRPQAEEDGV